VFWKTASLLIEKQLRTMNIAHEGLRQLLNDLDEGTASFTHGLGAIGSNPRFNNLAACREES
jgi:hypothetical protein